MKVQMKFQKTICIVTLITAALFFFIGLGLSTDIYNLFLTDIEGFKVYFDIQPFNATLVRLAIAMIVLAALLFLTMTHNRRRYYISNYVMIILITVVFIAISLYSIINLLSFRAQFLNELAIYGEEYKEFTEWNTSVKYIESTFWFDINIVTAVITIIVGLLLTGNLIWKTTLMKREDQLLSSQDNIDL